MSSFRVGAGFETNVASLSNGQFVVGFVTDHNYSGQVFGPYGNTVGSTFKMIDGGGFCSWGYSAPGLSGLTDGNFAVAGTSIGNPSYAAKLSPSGTALVPEFQYHSVPISSSAWKINPSIAPLPNGGFLTVWTDMNGDRSDTDIHARRFDSSGTALGTEFVVNTYTPNIQGLASAATFSDGSFVVTWMSTGNTGGSGYDIYFQRFDSSGNKVGSETMANTYTTGDQQFFSLGDPNNACMYATANHVAALSNNGFVITWNGGINNSVSAQIFDSSGNPVGSEITVNTTPNNSFSPAISVLPSGDFVIVWSDTSVSAIRGQRFTSSGATVGSEFTVTTSGQEGPSIAAFSSGNVYEGGFIVTWPDNTNSIQAQLYDANTNKVNPQNVIQGTSGDDNLTGTSGIDIILALDGNDVLEGKGGADVLNGGTGTDTASYATSSAGVTVNLAAGTATGGDADGDTLTAIENLTGSAQSDTLTGDSNDNVLEGKAGADVLNGGTGTDTASYATSSAGVTVDLTAGTATGGDADGDTLTAIENLAGSAFADTLTGDANANVLQGGDGDDTLEGKGGADVLTGGAGNDVFKVNQLSAGSNTATITDFQTGQDQVNLLEFTTITDFTHLSLISSNAGADTTIQLDSHNSLVFSGVASNTLSASDFVLAPLGNSGSGSDTSSESSWNHWYVIVPFTLGGVILITILAFFYAKYLKFLKTSKTRVVKFKEVQMTTNPDIENINNSPLGSPQNPNNVLSAIQKTNFSQPARVHPL